MFPKDIDPQRQKPKTEVLYEAQTNLSYLQVLILFLLRFVRLTAQQKRDSANKVRCENRACFQMKLWQNRVCQRIKVRISDLVPSGGEMVNFWWDSISISIGDNVML